MEIYTREEIAEQKNLRKKARLAAVVISAAAFLLCLVLLILVKPLNEKSFRIAACIAAALAGCFDIYIASFIMPYMRPKPVRRKTGGKVLHVLGNIVRQTHMYIIWILLSAVLVSFLFNLATDTRPAKKVTIYADVESIRQPELETVLGENLPEGIRMVKVRTFSYHTFGMGKLGADDIYIVSADNMEQYAEGFAAAEDFLGKEKTAELVEAAQLRLRDGQVQVKSPGSFYGKDGKLCGILIYYYPACESGAASEYIDYSKSGADAVSYYLCFGKDSLHPGKDGAAADAAAKLLQLK